MKKGKALTLGGFVSGNILGTIRSIVPLVIWTPLFYATSRWLEPFAIVVLAFGGIVLLIDIFTILGILGITLYSRRIRTTPPNYHEN